MSKVPDVMVEMLSRGAQAGMYWYPIKIHARAGTVITLLTNGGTASQNVCDSQVFVITTMLGSDCATKPRYTLTSRKGAG